MKALRNILGLVLLAGMVLPGVAVRADRSVAVPFTAVGGAQGVTISWRLPSGVAPAATIAAWPSVERGGVLLPQAQLTVLLPDDSATPQNRTLESESWRGELPPAAAFDPSAYVDDGRRLLEPEGAPLPRQPVSVLRRSAYRGQHLLVVALNPVFRDDRGWQIATTLDVLLPGAELLDEAAPLSAQGQAGAESDATPFAASAVPGPTNPAAQQLSLVIEVASAGIQRVSGATLAAAGLTLTTLDPDRLQLWFGGAPVALELIGADDGRIDSADELRFFAPEPGDRWNAVDRYRLTFAESAPLRMVATTAGVNAAAPSRTTALDRGVWRNNTLYDSTLAGPDGDHWFSADLRTGPGMSAATLDVTLPAGLPLASGSATFEVSGSAYTWDEHQLRLRSGSASQTLRWHGGVDFAQRFELNDVTASLTLSLEPGAAFDGLEIDAISWQRPVTLDFGERGAFFATLNGSWTYQLSRTPAGRALYDVSDARRPRRVVVPHGADFAFTSPAASFVISGPGTAWNPVVALRQPVDLAAPRAADAIYIAPAQFHAALAPLIELRRGQGHTPTLIDVQTIYDAWSGGAVSPEAIRTFLRYAVATWTPAPRAVVLVGDGSSDPRNYLGRNNPTLIPPYLAMVDRYIGETACDACYAQLDGDDPTTDYLPDLWFGRLPVKSVDELRAVVSKITRYETEPFDAGWRSRNVFIADNADGGGDFAAYSDRSVALQPATAQIERVYYDPTVPASTASRERDPVRAYQRTIAAFNAGAGLLNYTGHGYVWQWAVTNPTVSPPNLLGLYDADTLSNGAATPIVLAMTCFTSAFQQPSFSGTSIDERLVLRPNGGAIAAWGSTGLGTVPSHDLLQQGFYTALWAAPPTSATLGQLTAAGYREVFDASNGSDGDVMAFVLLGDPLMRARVAPGPDYVPPTNPTPPSDPTTPAPPADTRLFVPMVVR